MPTLFQLARGYANDLNSTNLELGIQQLFFGDSFGSTGLSLEAYINEQKKELETWKVFYLDRALEAAKRDGLDLTMAPHVDVNSPFFNLQLQQQQETLAKFVKLFAEELRPYVASDMIPAPTAHEEGDFSTPLPAMTRAEIKAYLLEVDNSAVFFFAEDIAAGHQPLEGELNIVLLDSEAEGWRLGIVDKRGGDANNIVLFGNNSADKELLKDFSAKDPRSFALPEALPKEKGDSGFAVRALLNVYNAETKKGQSEFNAPKQYEALPGIAEQRKAFYQIRQERAAAIERRKQPQVELEALRTVIETRLCRLEGVEKLEYVSNLENFLDRTYNKEELEKLNKALIALELLEPNEKYRKGILWHSLNEKSASASAVALCTPVKDPISRLMEHLTGERGVHYGAEETPTAVVQPLKTHAINLVEKVLGHKPGEDDPLVTCLVELGKQCPDGIARMMIMLDHAIKVGALRVTNEQMNLFLLRLTQMDKEKSLEQYLLNEMTLKNVIQEGDKASFTIRSAGSLMQEFMLKEAELLKNLFVDNAFKEQADVTMEKLKSGPTVFGKVDVSLDGKHSLCNDYIGTVKLADKPDEEALHLHMFKGKAHDGIFERKFALDGPVDAVDFENPDEQTLALAQLVAVMLLSTKEGNSLKTLGAVANLIINSHRQPYNRACQSNY